MANVIRGAQGNKEAFSIKGGQSTPLGGMRPDFAPSAQRPTDFVNLENIRRVGGNITSRGGQAEFATLQGEATGVVDFQSGDGGLGLYFTAENSDGYPSLYKYDPLAKPKVQLVARSQVPGWSISHGLGLLVENASIQSSGGLPGFSGLVEMDSGVIPPVLWRINPPRPEAGVATDAVFPGSALTAVLEIPLMDGIQYQRGGGVLQSGNRLFLAVSDSAGGDNASIFSFDGLSLTREHNYFEAFFAPTIQPGARYRDTVVFWRIRHTIGVPATNALYALVRGESGVWTQFGPLAMDNSGVVTPQTVSYKDKLYVACSHTKLYTFDGAALVSLPPAITGIDVPLGATILDVAVMGGYLYYSWGSGGGAIAQMRIGRFDGTTWEPNHKDLFAQFPYGTGLLSMVASGGSLYVGWAMGVGDVRPGLLKSPGSNTSGTWEHISLGLSDPSVAWNLRVF
jgi:hypothetical protein